jgi:hypothetical protein
LKVKQRNWTLEEDPWQWRRQAMMPFARRASLVVVLLLLASVGTASAECAWVLWRETWTNLANDGREEIDSAHASLPDCDAALGTVVISLRVDGYQPIVGGLKGNRNVLAMKAGKWQSYRCLPDTIDPRGPKGSR